MNNNVILRDLTFLNGKCVIYNVPHQMRGVFCTRTASVELQLAALYQYMKEHKISCYDFEFWRDFDEFQ